MDLPIYIDRSSPLPLYAQLKTALQHAIRRGDLAYGEKLPSENEFMELLGLSRMTIRSALSQLASENYIHKLHGKGTFVCYNAESAAAGKIDVLLDVTYAYFSSHYIKSISDVLSANNYQFVIHDTQDNQEHICDILEKILQVGSAGILLQPSHMVEPQLPRLRALLLAISESGIPCVTIDRSIEGISTTSVVFDDYLGGRIAAEYLVSLGHKRCAMVCCSNFVENEPRFNGFNDLLIEKGLPPLMAVEKNKELEANLVGLIRREHVTAVFNYNDEVALKTFRFLSAAGIRIPQDVSVLGYDDTVLTKATDPQMTSVIHPKEMLGHISAKQLLSLVEQRHYAPPEDQLYPRLSIRSSCCQAKK
jgi:GntR family transcriptional regulator of arabinose operon